MNKGQEWALASPEDAVVQALTAAAVDVCVIDDRVTGEAQAQVDRDSSLIEELDRITRPILRIWRNAQCIVASRSQAAATKFSQASALSTQLGWPVAVRRSGGTAVAHRPGILNVSYAEAFPAGLPRPSLSECYLRLLRLLISAMSRLSVQCDYGPVPASCCDGKFNLRWRGRKLAGTAGAISRRGDAALSVFHASISVTGSSAADVDAIEQFEAALGHASGYRARAHVSLAEILFTQQRSTAFELVPERRDLSASMNF